MLIQMDFLGKSIFVTGASSGIGRVVSLSFARANPQLLIITGRDAERLAAVASECSVHCPQVRMITGDMSCESDVRAVADFVERETRGALDVFVGCHGTHGGGARKLSDFRATFDVNFMSMVELTNVLGRFIRPRGAIVFVTSGRAARPDGARAAYCSSKAALKMFMKCCAIDLGKRGIRVNAVAPGPVDTPFRDGLHASAEERDDELRRVRATLPDRRLPTAQGVANCVMFLASDLASDITGHEQVVDCGLQCV